jgi:tetratricopeptide (TPR) repeat protein
VPGRQTDRLRQKAAAGRDANVAGRDQVIVNIGAAGAGEPGVPGLLPRDVPGFTGREQELDRLTALTGGGSVVVTAIGGTAGVGKTALAVHAAHRLLPEFPDGHLYADLRGYTAGQVPAEPGEVLEVFLRRLGVPGEEMPVRVEERSGLLRQLLASRRLLMVLDNARSEAQVRLLLPGAGGSLVLITSRSVLPGLEVDERIGLGALAEDEATALLAGLIGPERAAAEPGAVVRVRDWCGCLPLALRIAGQLLVAHPAWPVARLAGMLADERDRLGRLSAGDLQVRAAFALSYRQLADGDARLFRLLGLHPGSDFDVAAAASLAEIDPVAAGPVLDRLVLASLVSEDGSGRFGMHDLVRLFARGTCQEADDQAARDDAEARLVGYYADLASLLDACLDLRQRPVAAQAAEQAAEQAGGSLLSPRQALARFETERLSLLAGLALAVQRGWDEQVWQLSVGMEDSLLLLRYLGDLLVGREAALAVARRAGDTAAEGGTLNGLGEAYRELRRFEEAIGCYQESLAIFRETGDRHAEGQVRGNLGIAYGELRRFEEAIGSFQESLAIFRKTGDRRDQGLTLTSLGEAYRELRRFEEAIGCYQESLAIFRETGDLHGQGLTLKNLGSAYQAMRQPDRAAVCWRDAAAAMRDAGDHEEAEHLEQDVANARSPWRRWRRSG